MGFFDKIKEKYKQREQEKLQRQKEKELLELRKKEYLQILNEIVCKNDFSNKAKVDFLVRELPQDFYEKETRKIVQNYLRKLVTRDLVTEEEYQQTNEIISTFGISCPDFQIIQAKYTLWRHENTETIPEYETTHVMLKNGEKLYFEYPASLCKYVRRTNRVNYHGPVLNFKIMGGLKYKVGSLGLGKDITTSLEKIDSGYFFITDKRVAFVGDFRNFSYAIDKIAKYGVTDDGLLIQKENLVNPQIVELGNYEAALAVVSDMIEKLKK